MRLFQLDNKVSQTGWLGLEANCWFLLYLFELREQKSGFRAKINHFSIEINFILKAELKCRLSVFNLLL